LHHGPARRLQQDEADQPEPDAVDQVAAQEEQDPDRDEEVGEALAEPRGAAGGAVAITGDLPRDRPGDAAAV
jgi:hypothetical protein